MGLLEFLSVNMNKFIIVAVIGVLLYAGAINFEWVRVQIEIIIRTCGAVLQ
jgi:hypothetical protein